MADEPDYIVDINGVESPSGAPGTDRPTGRRWIGVQFDCCGTYTRVYRNRAGTAYEGFCPRCTRRVRVPIGPGGTSQRIFRAS